MSFKIIFIILVSNLSLLYFVSEIKAQKLYFTISGLSETNPDANSDSLMKMSFTPVLFINLLEKDPLKSNKMILTDSNGVVVNPFNTLTLVKVELGGIKKFIDTLKINSIEPSEIHVTLKRLIYETQPLVVTAQYSPSSQDQSLYRVRVIDSKRIEMQAAVNLADLLSKELNIRISQDNAIGASAMSIIGMSGQNVKILIDGVPLIGRLDGNLDLTQINLNNIERIEIIEGPMSVLYGTDALAGAINLITKKSAFNKWKIAANTYYESIGKYNFDLSLGRNVGRIGRFRLDMGRNYFDGWSQNESSRTKSWRPKEQYFGGLIYDKQWKKWKINLTSNILREKLTSRGVPTITPNRAYAFDEFYFTQRFDNTFQINGFIEPHRYLDFTFGYSYYNRIKNTYYKDLVTLEQKISPNQEQQDTNLFHRVMARGIYSMNKAQSKFNYQIGYDSYAEIALGQRIFDNTQQMTDLALFGSIEYRPIKRITIRPGIRAAYNTKFVAPLTPSFNIKYDINEKISFRGSYARGFRAPSLKELFLDFVDASHNVFGNRDLKAEYSNYFSLSANYKLISDKSLTKFELVAFINDLKDRIYLGPAISGGTGSIGKDDQVMPFTYINMSGFKSVGFQANFKYRRERCGIETGVSYIGNQVSTLQIQSALIFSPEISSQVFYDIRKIKLRTAVFYKFNGRLQSYAVVDQSTLEQFYTEAYHTIDFTLSKYFSKKNYVIITGIKNIANVTNVKSLQGGGGIHNAGSVTQPIGMGRSLFVSLKFNF